MTTPLLPSLKETISKHGLEPQKRLGQNFILDDNILDKIAHLATLQFPLLADSTVIEIGPGPGGLTRALLRRGIKTVHAVEKDERCLKALEELASYYPGRLKTFHEDALKLDYADVGDKPRYVVANLPYNVGTALFVHFLTALPLFDGFVLMFQKEVAERIVASEKDDAYGRLSILSSFLGKAEILMTLPPGAFFPPPKVTSALISFRPHEKPLYPVPLKALEKVTNTAFSMRRKMLRSSLKALGDPLVLCEAGGVSPTMRAEEVSPLSFCKMAEVLIKKQPEEPAL